MKNLSTILLQVFCSARAVTSFTPILGSNNHHHALLRNTGVYFPSSSPSFSTTTNRIIGTSLSESNLPSIEQLSSDPFMKQIGHASAYIIPLLEQNENNNNNNNNNKNNNDKDNESTMDEANITQLIKAQLSHSDGIRGFFVSYLTGVSDDSDETTISAADSDTVPKPLRDAMNDVDNMDELISLACMNVIMPVGMTTMHEDPDLAKSSEMTANRGKKVLQVLLDKNGTRVQCEAIRNVAMGRIESREDDTDIKYWIDFFDKWGYKDVQKQDIQKAMAEILDE